jgi:hypothetical protein
VHARSYSEVKRKGEAQSRVMDLGLAAGVVLLLAVLIKPAAALAARLLG